MEDVVITFTAEEANTYRTLAKQQRVYELKRDIVNGVNSLQSLIDKMNEGIGDIPAILEEAEIMQRRNYEAMGRYVVAKQELADAMAHLKKKAPSNG